MKKIAIFRIATIAIVITLFALFGAQAETPFSCDAFSINLPDDLKPLDAPALAGYEAAVQADYPDAGDTLLIAKNDSGSAVVYIAAGGNSAPQAAAESAAGLLLGDASAATETQMGNRTVWGFACSVDDTRFDIYYLKEGESAFVIGVTGLDSNVVADMVSSMRM